jgi:hypothetical protein
MSHDVTCAYPILFHICWLIPYLIPNSLGIPWCPMISAPGGAAFPAHRAVGSWRI